MTAINSLRSDLDSARQQAAQPPLEQFVPRADHDAVLERATNAERQLDEHRKTQHKAAVDSAIRQALEAKKIAPASREYYEAMCQTEAGLTAFKAFLEKAPALVTDSGLDGRDPGQGGAAALNSEQLKIAAALGIPAADYAKQLGASQ